MWSLDLYQFVGALAFGYALGSVPFGLVLTRLAGAGDIRAIGSGNIGATNVLRTGRKGLAAATLLCDVFKGTIAVLAIDWLWGRDAAILAGAGAFFGHLFPAWLALKGGKGVATYLGVLVALAWPAALGFGAVWLAVAALSRYSSLAALAASASTPPILWLLDYRREAGVILLLTLVLWIRHRDNIRRLLAGTEGKIGRKAEAPSRT